MAWCAAGGARTGRWASSPNLANRPPWFRPLIVAPEGWKIVGGDSSQLELRVSAALSGDADLIHRIARADEKKKLDPDYDPHSNVARVAFGEQFTKLDENNPKQKLAKAAIRTGTKRCVYGINYMAGAAKILDVLMEEGYEGPTLTIGLVQRMIDSVFIAYPGLKTRIQNSILAAERTGIIREPVFGRRRVFPLKRIPPTEAANSPIQAAGASIMAKMLWGIHCDLPRVAPRAFLFAQVHDAFYYLCPDEYVPALLDCMTLHMNTEIVLVPGAPPMPIVATPKAVQRWEG
jgi:DNA polymerase I-like protein with 3'-5' exonuclease and polymerase domains